MYNISAYVLLSQVIEMHYMSCEKASYVHTIWQCKQFCLRILLMIFPAFSRAKSRRLGTPCFWVYKSDFGFFLYFPGRDKGQRKCWGITFIDHCYDCILSAQTFCEPLIFVLLKDTGTEWGCHGIADMDMPTLGWFSRTFASTYWCKLVLFN